MKFIKLVLISLLISAPMLFAANKDKNTATGDLMLEAKLWASYAVSDELSPFDIEIDVDNGTAILSGMVDSKRHAQLAKEIAEGTEGIKDIDSRLVVADKPDMVVAISEIDLSKPLTNGSTETLIESKFLTNRHVAGQMIEVKVKDKTAILNGTVYSDRSHDVAEMLALDTLGVEEVENNLDVEATHTDDLGEVAEERMFALQDSIDDTWLTAKVNSQLMWSSGVDAGDIDVHVNDGKVLLTGHVQNTAQRDLAKTLASGIVGVHTVDVDKLKIQ